MRFLSMASLFIFLLKIWTGSLRFNSNMLWNYCDADSARFKTWPSSFSDGITARLQRQVFHVIFLHKEENTNLTWVPLGLANCALVRSHSNAISDICFYANDLVLKTTSIKHLVFWHRIRDWFHAISQDGSFIYFCFKNLDRFFTFQL